MIIIKRIINIFIVILVVFLLILTTQTINRKNNEVNYEEEIIDTVTTTSITEPTEKLQKNIKMKKNKAIKVTESKEIKIVSKVTKETATQTKVTTPTDNTIKSNTTKAYKEYSVPSSIGSFKSYTNYLLLSKSSPQWTKIQCDNNAYTDNNGLRKVGEYYCVAMGSYYSQTLGDLFEIETTNGSFKAIICDFKADVHTDSTHRYTLTNYCITEFYVDTNVLNSKIKQMGNVSYANSNFMGDIISIKKLGNYFSN